MSTGRLERAFGTKSRARRKGEIQLHSGSIYPKHVLVRGAGTRSGLSNGFLIYRESAGTVSCGIVSIIRGEAALKDGGLSKYPVRQKDTSFREPLYSGQDWLFGARSGRFSDDLKMSCSMGT